MFKKHNHPLGWKRFLYLPLDAIREQLSKLKQH